MPRIKIIHSAQTPRINLNVNGEPISFSATGESDVPDRFMGALTDSGVQFEIVDSGDGDDEGRAGALGGIGDTRPAKPLPEAGADIGVDVELLTEEQGGLTPSDTDDSKGGNHPNHEQENQDVAQNADLAILDENIENASAKLGQLDAARLGALREAETNGKSRIGMLAAIDEALAAREPQKP